MTFEGTLQFLVDHIGKTVDVEVTLPVAGADGPVHIAGFWGGHGFVPPGPRRVREREAVRVSGTRGPP